MTERTMAEAFGEALSSQTTCQIGALPVVYPVLETLGLREIVNDLRYTRADIDLGRITELLTLNRLLAPRPLCWVKRWAGDTVLPEVLDMPVSKLYDNRLGRALDALHPFLGEIWASVAARAVTVYQVDLSIVHWDITSFFFEGEYTTSELLRRGYSRDKRPDAKQVNLGMDVSHEDEIPFLYWLWPGNRSDDKTALPHVKALQAFLTRPELADLMVRPMIVSDSKMVTPEAVFACHDNRLFYLGSVEQDDDVKELIRSVSDEELRAHELSYRPQRQRRQDDFVPYRGVLRPITFRLDERAVTDRALVVWSAGKARLDQQKGKTCLKRLLNGLARIQGWMGKRCYTDRDYIVRCVDGVQRGNPARRWVDVEITTAEDERLGLKFRVNPARLAAARALEGKYVLATNAAHLSADDILRIHKGQDKVEKANRTVKGPLRVRPVFLRTDERIEGLVLCTMLALLVRSISALQCRRAGLSLTADQVLAEFANLRAIDLSFSDGSRRRVAGDLSATQEQILTTLNLPPVTRYVTLPS
ncbi:MAG TPA: IS1634 family transposase [Anaerolineae bacterium]|nr:IS1634 family transposase [Anaerolineae bacterium]